jgi:AraC-like DNA-binding protein
VIDTRVHAAMVGVHFRPGGAFPFFRLPLHELCDRHVDLRSLWGADAGELRERLCAAATPGQRFRLLESALLRHLDPARQPRGAVQLAVDWLGQTPAGVGAVVQRVGLSHRRFIEVFTSEVGMTPKLFGRIVRFQQALGRAGRLATPAWADLARQCGYFDQSHLVRDFLAFSGLSPAGYLRQRSARVKASHVPAPP